MIKLSILTLGAMSIFLLTACTEGPAPITENTFMYNDHNFGENRNANYKQGVIDGCKTSAGDYSKNHALFKNNQSYSVGWEDGRINCTNKEN